MTTQHTQGRLAVANGSGRMIISPDRVPCIAETYGDEAQENARRLVAAWNACEGFTTETLEQYTTLSGIIRQRDVVIAERDELLAALKHIEGVAMADEWRDLPDIAKHARAAIAKVEGGAA